MVADMFGGVFALKQESFCNAVLWYTARTPRMALTKLRVHDGLQINLSDHLV